MRRLAKAMPSLPEKCENSGTKGRIACTAYFGPGDSSKYPTPSVYLEEPFKRQGLFYGELGFTFSTVSYSGGLISKPSTATGVQKKDKKTAPEQPLSLALIEIYGINWQGYARFGLTPKYLPDLLVSVGLGLQTAGGRVKIFKEDSVRFVVQPDAFAEGDVVVARYATGALTFYYAVDQNVLGKSGSKIVDDNPSGTDLTDMHLSLITAALGIKLLFPF